MLFAKVLKQTGKLSRCIVHLLPKTRHDLSCSKQDGSCGARRCGKPPFPMHGCTVSLGPWPPRRAPRASPCQVFGGGGSGPAQRPCSWGRPHPTGAVGKGSLTVVMGPTPACGSCFCLRAWSLPGLQLRRGTALPCPAVGPAELAPPQTDGLA